jgi:hypothetical protein
MVSAVLEGTRTRRVTEIVEAVEASRGRHAPLKPPPLPTLRLAPYSVPQQKFYLAYVS